jgi:transposase-like protein
MAFALVKQPNPSCPSCLAAYTTKKGRRRNRHRIIPLFQCNECGHRFTNDAGKYKTYPLKTILDAVSTFNLGYSLTETQRVLRKRAQTDIPERTIRSWVSEYRPLTTYARLRGESKSVYTPTTIIRSHTFDHQQVYRFGVHQAKLKTLLGLPAHRHLAPLVSYLRDVQTAFPHHLFQTTEHRSSKFPATINPPITRKENHATRIAALVLPTSPSNKERHETLQHFMLENGTTLT